MTQMTQSIWGQCMTVAPDPTLRRLLLDFTRAGGSLAFDGDRLDIAGTPHVPLLAQALENRAADIRRYLVPAVSDEEADRVRTYLADAGAEVFYVTDDGTARQAVATLVDDAKDTGVVGLDMETTPLVPFRQPLPVKINQDGTKAVRQPKSGAGGIALDPHRSRVRLVQAWAGTGAVYVFDLDHIPIDVLAPLRELPMAIFNAVFEVKRLIHMGIEPTSRIYDVMTAIWLTDGKRPGLEEAARIYFGIDVPKALGASDWGKPVLSQEQIEYAALDAVLCVLLWQQQREEFEEPDDQAQGIVDDVTKAIARMELNGIPIDMDAHRLQIATWRTELATARDKLRVAAGPFNLETPSGVRAYLENILADDAIDTWPTTPKGLLSTRRDLLERNRDLPAIPELLAVRRLSTLIANFGDTLIASVNPVTGNLHASFLPAGASTGRFSSRGPNLQQMPKKRMKGFRRIFRAPAGQVFMALDYSQIELRAAGEIISDWFECDSILRQGFGEGLDAHVTTAMRMTGKTNPEDVTPEEREAAKPCNFGLLYRMGERGFFSYLKASFDPDGRLTYDEAARRRNAFFEGYPDLAAWQDEYANFSREQGYTQTIAGRRWWWCWQARDPDDLSSDEPFYEDKLEGFRGSYAVNHPIQGSCAEVMAIALTRLDQRLRDFGAEMVATVHDEVVLTVSDNRETVDTVAAIAVTEMTEAFLEVFPDAPTLNLIEPMVGPTWGDLIDLASWLVQQESQA